MHTQGSGCLLRHSALSYSLWYLLFEVRMLIAMLLLLSLVLRTKEKRYVSCSHRYYCTCIHIKIILLCWDLSSVSSGSEKLDQSSGSVAQHITLGKVSSTFNILRSFGSWDRAYLWAQVLQNKAKSNAESFKVRGFIWGLCEKHILILLWNDLPSYFYCLPSHFAHQKQQRCKCITDGKPLIRNRNAPNNDHDIA